MSSIQYIIQADLFCQDPDYLVWLPEDPWTIPRHEWSPARRVIPIFSALTMSMARIELA